MPLFEMQPEAIVAVPRTTFAAERVLERADLQRLLRAHISVIGDDMLVVAEEFGAFTEARRRIDLLGVDREGRLVVVELKRTVDGGHLELQALRYAAMVSAMTFLDLVDHYEQYLVTGDSIWHNMAVATRVRGCQSSSRQPSTPLGSVW